MLGVALGDGVFIGWELGDILGDGVGIEAIGVELGIKLGDSVGSAPVAMLG